MLSRGWGDAGGTDRAGQWLVGDGMMRLLTSAACDRAFAPLPPTPAAADYHRSHPSPLSRVMPYDTIRYFYERSKTD